MALRVGMRQTRIPPQPKTREHFCEDFERIQRVCSFREKRSSKFGYSRGLDRRDSYCHGGGVSRRAGLYLPGPLTWSTDRASAAIENGSAYPKTQSFAILLPA